MYDRVLLSVLRELEGQAEQLSPILALMDHYGVSVIRSTVPQQAGEGGTAR